MSERKDNKDPESSTLKISPELGSRLTDESRRLGLNRNALAEQCLEYGIDSLPEEVDLFGRPVEDDYDR